MYFHVIIPYILPSAFIIFEIDRKWNWILVDRTGPFFDLPICGVHAVHSNESCSYLGQRSASRCARLSPNKVCWLHGCSGNDKVWKKSVCFHSSTIGSHKLKWSSFLYQGVTDLFKLFKGKNQELILWQVKPSVLRIWSSVMAKNGVIFSHCSTESELEDIFESMILNILINVYFNFLNNAQSTTLKKNIFNRKEDGN